MGTPADVPAGLAGKGADPDRRKRLLIIFRHGLGDCVQLQIVLRHLRETAEWMDWDVDVEIGRGKASAVRHLCRKVFEHGVDAGPSADDYDRIEDLGWYENYSRDPRYPQTKPVNCLKEVFGIEPNLQLMYYSFGTAFPPQYDAVREYVKACSRGRKTLLLHYQGNTSESRKNLPHEVAAAICTYARRANWCVIILDWDGRTPLVDNETVFNPGTENPIWGGSGTGDAETILAIVSQCDLFIGVDSGPLHVAAGPMTLVNVIGVWLEHSPVQFIDLNTATHLVPEDWRNRPPVHGDAEVIKFTEEHYKLVEYPIAEGLHTGAARVLMQLLSSAFSVKVPEPVMTGDHENLVSWGEFWVHSDNVYQDLIVVRDIYDSDAYQTGHLPSNRGPGEVVVDIGGHIGAFAKKWKWKNPDATICCVEACPENLEALRKNAGEFATIIHAACTYEKGTLALKNSCFSNCESTGGSMVVVDDGSDFVSPDEFGRYLQDRRPLTSITIEQIMERLEVDHIDVLKLDCEGSEFSILRNSPAVRDGRVRFILGEYHGRAKWDALLQERFTGWDYGHMHASGDLGIFHLRRQD